MTCCHIDCGNTAEFRIEWDPPTADNFTDACEAHVGALLGHRPDQPVPNHYRVYPIGSSSVEPSPVKPSTSLGKGADATKSAAEPVRRPETLPHLDTCGLKYGCTKCTCGCCTENGNGDV